MRERGARHMFQIIIDYPESRHGGVLDDLKRCVSIVGKRHLIIDNVRNEFNKRLLHPGVGTTEILAAFINAIRVLRYLDSTGVMMELACHSVKQFLAYMRNRFFLFVLLIFEYFRRREDTIRVIVSNMNEHGVLELDELTQR
jgi:anaphase-promoting complex subunit 2